MAARFSLTSSPTCPTCNDLFTSYSGQCGPAILSCGHTVCAACAEGLTRAVPPLCTLCMTAISTSFTLNYSLADIFAAHVQREASDTPAASSEGCTSAGSLPLPGPADAEVLDSGGMSVAMSVDGKGAGASPSSLEVMKADCDARVSVLAAAAKDVRECRQRLCANSDAAVSALWTSIAAMKSRLDALGAEYESDIRRVCGDRAKALDAQEEELTVTEAQLQWASAMAGSAAGPLQPKAQGRVMEDVACMTRLCAKPYEGPIVSSHLSVRVREDRDFLCAVRGQIAIVRAAVDGGKSVLEGPGLASFVCGDSRAVNAVNIIRARIMDEFGAPCGWVSKQDVLLTISSLSDGGSSVGSVKRITVVEPGVFDVIYQVLEAVTELWLRVSVCGVTVGSGSRRVSLTPPFQTLVGSLSSYHRGMYNGIAVSPDGNWLLLSCALNHYLHDEEQFEGEEDWLAVSGPECKLYLTSLRYGVGAVGTRVLGSRGGGDAQFNYPHGVCFGRDNTLLVCDTGNNRVQELSLGGAFIRAFPCGGCFVISTNGAVIAIGGSSRDAGNIASLHDYNTGVLIRTIGAPLPLDAPPPAPKFTSSICFTEDGLKLFALETSTGVAAMGVWQRGPPRILEFTKDGTFTQVVASGPGAVPSDCAQLSVTPAGDIIASSSCSPILLLLSTTLNSVTRKWNAHLTQPTRPPKVAQKSTKRSRVASLPSSSDSDAEAADGSSMYNALGPVNIHFSNCTGLVVRGGTLFVLDEAGSVDMFQ